MTAQALRGLLAALIAVAAGSTPAPAAGPSTPLAHPPGGARRFAIVSIAGRHGWDARWTDAQGQLHGRESLHLRGQDYELDDTIHYGRHGAFDRVVVRGSRPAGDAAERFALNGDVASWISPVDAGSSSYRHPALYAAFGGPLDVTAALAEAVVAAPAHARPLLPGGRVTAERLTNLTVGEGPTRKRVVLYALDGLDLRPTLVWMEDGGTFFAQVGLLSYLPEGYEGERARLAQAQDGALARRYATLARRLLRPRRHGTAFVHVRAFLDGARFKADQTVVVEDGVIVAVGSSARIRPPREATVIDGRGRTLVPGLWDAHHHVSGDAEGPLLLSLGITSVRDPGNDNTLTLARAARRAAGELLAPHIYPSFLIDGEGRDTAQTASVAHSQAEALALVDQAKELGFRAIKIYGSLDKDWVTPLAAHAHAFGLHVHGHLPAGLRPLDAVAAGYDELTHIYFVMMQAMPQSVVDHSNGIARFEGPGRYGADVDLGAEPMRGLIATLAARRIAVDPTLVVAEALYASRAGDLGAAYVPYRDVLPPAVLRDHRQGGFAPPPGVTRAGYRASFARMRDLVGALHAAGAPIVAGTDATGLELVRELELYVQAGLTPAQALASATVVPAGLVGVQDRTGTIAAGKTADLLLIDGDPSRRIGDLRHVSLVMIDGRILPLVQLREAVGLASPAVSGATRALEARKRSRFQIPRRGAASAGP